MNCPQGNQRSKSSDFRLPVVHFSMREYTTAGRHGGTAPTEKIPHGVARRGDSGLLAALRGSYFEKTTCFLGLMPAGYWMSSLPGLGHSTNNIFNAQQMRNVQRCLNSPTTCVFIRPAGHRDVQPTGLVFTTSRRFAGGRSGPGPSAGSRCSRGGIAGRTPSGTRCRSTRVRPRCRRVAGFR